MISVDSLSNENAVEFYCYAKALSGAQLLAATFVPH
jgi:hypothetical protein